MNFNRHYTEISEWYWLTEYLDYSNLSFPTITIQSLQTWVRLHD